MMMMIDCPKTLCAPMVKAMTMSFAVIGLLVGCVLMSTTNATAATGPLTVYGTVYDNMGYPLEGASVVITIVETAASRSTTTDESGFYTCAADEFAAGDYDEGDTIQVVATYNSVEATNSTAVTALMEGNGIAGMDVHYLTEIPEFGSLFGVLLVSIALGVVALSSSRRKRA